VILFGLVAISGTLTPSTCSRQAWKSWHHEMIFLDADGASAVGIHDVLLRSAVPLTSLESQALSSTARPHVGNYVDYLVLPTHHVVFRKGDTD